VSDQPKARYPFRCGVCDGESVWRITRTGDVVTSWACDEHPAAECHGLQRNRGLYEVTALVIESQSRLREVAEMRKTFADVGGAP
jgi:hypothetical protein